MLESAGNYLFPRPERIDETVEPYACRFPCAKARRMNGSIQDAMRHRHLFVVRSENMKKRKCCPGCYRQRDPGRLLRFSRKIDCNENLPVSGDRLPRYQKDGPSVEADQFVVPEPRSDAAEDGIPAAGNHSQPGADFIGTPNNRCRIGVRVMQITYS